MELNGERRKRKTSGGGMLSASGHGVEWDGPASDCRAVWRGVVGAAGVVVAARVVAAGVVAAVVVAAAAVVVAAAAVVVAAAAVVGAGVNKPYACSMWVPCFPSLYVLISCLYFLTKASS